MPTLLALAANGTDAIEQRVLALVGSMVSDTENKSFNKLKVRSSILKMPKVLNGLPSVEVPIFLYKVPNFQRMPNPMSLL
jgi:hypothetical protein